MPMLATPRSYTCSAQQVFRTVFWGCVSPSPQPLCRQWRTQGRHISSSIRRTTESGLESGRRRLGWLRWLVDSSCGSGRLPAVLLRVQASPSARTLRGRRAVHYVSSCQQRDSVSLCAYHLLVELLQLEVIRVAQVGHVWGCARLRGLTRVEDDYRSFMCDVKSEVVHDGM